MRIIRVFAYPAAIICFVLLIIDGAHSLARGTVVLISIAEAWELLEPYLTNFVSIGNSFVWDPALPQPIPVNQSQIPASKAFQFPASLAMIFVTSAIFLIDTATGRLAASIKHRLRQITFVRG